MLDEVDGGADVDTAAATEETVREDPEILRGLVEEHDETRGSGEVGRDQDWDVWSFGRGDVEGKTEGC